MNPNINLELPDELDAAIGDRNLQFKQQLLLKHLYEHDIRSVTDRCNRNYLEEQLDLSDKQSKDVTEALADAGLITIEKYPSIKYYTLDISDPSPERHDHYQQLTTNPTPPTNGSAGQTQYSTPSPLTAPPPTDPQTTTPEKTNTTTPAPSSNSIDNVGESSEGDTNPDSGDEQQRTPHGTAHKLSTDTHHTTPPEPARFATTTIALTGLLHYLSILSQELALSTLLLLNIVYAAAFALTVHNITPSQLPATVKSSLP
jgi:hypothetical protein